MQYYFNCNWRTHSYTRALLYSVYEMMGVVRPGESVHVNLVCVDETHVFKHAEDALQTHNRISYISVSLNASLDLSRSHCVSYQRRVVVGQGARRVRELGEARVDLLHGFDPRHQQLRNLFL